MTAILQYIGTWWGQKQAEQARWDALASKLQLESVMAGHDFEQQQAAIPIPYKPATTIELSNMLRVLAITSIACCSGCFTEHIATHEYKPILMIPEPPAGMLEGPEALTPREQLFGQYIVTLKKIILNYNSNAAAENKAYGYH
jgi:hypothetical protein